MSQLAFDLPGVDVGKRAEHVEMTPKPVDGRLVCSVCVTANGDRLLLGLVRSGREAVSAAVISHLSVCGGTLEEES